MSSIFGDTPIDGITSWDLSQLSIRVFNLGIMKLQLLKVCTTLFVPDAAVRRSGCKAGTNSGLG